MDTAGIPFNRAVTAPNQIAYVEQSFRSGAIAGDGPFSERAAELLQTIHGTERVLLTPSCTAALELSAMLLGIEPGDEVVVPSFTFVSSASAFALLGARIVFADIDPATFVMGPDDLAECITNCTKAVVTVNYGGVNAATPEFMDLARRHGLMVIEDNAHGLFGSYRGEPLGTFGALSTLSFHETKNVSTGEGGALVINDPELVERAEIHREKGTDRSRFFRGQVDKYSWVDLGSSYLMSDITAAILLAQLEHGEVIQELRQSTAKRYRSDLASWAQTNGAAFQFEPEGHCPPAHLCSILLPTPSDRERFLKHMRAAGVHAVFHYVPLHNSPAGERYGSSPSGCPVTVDVSERLVRLPLFSDQKLAETNQIVEAVLEFHSA